ncbi:MAG: hypothetical protein KIS92_07675 [Planctomycetota bacterium]|nr:hypothetical protein [Planctomycetota bacterium]
MAADSSKPMPWRLFMWTAILALFGSGGVYLADRLVLEQQRQQQKVIEEKNKQIEALEAKRKELEGFVQRLKKTERRATVYVADQQKSEDGRVTTTVRFTEIDAEGNPVQEYPDFTLDGDEIYIDAFAITFDDAFVEQGDALKGKSLLIFRRIFSNKLQPDSGYTLDKKGQAPLAYAGKEAPSEIERDLWTKFWEIPEDPKLREKYGVRNAQGTAVMQRVRKNNVLVLEVRSTGEVTMKKVTDLIKEEKKTSPAGDAKSEPAAPEKPAEAPAGKT